MHGGLARKASDRSFRVTARSTTDWRARFVVSSKFRRRLVRADVAQPKRRSCSSRIRFQTRFGFEHRPSIPVQPLRDLLLVLQHPSDLLRNLSYLILSEHPSRARSRSIYRVGCLLGV